MTTIKTVYDLNVAVEEVAQAQGGLAIKMQLGEVGTRATSDLDGVFALDDESTLAGLQDHLKRGWHSGAASCTTVGIRLEDSSSGGVTPDSVMIRWLIALTH